MPAASAPQTLDDAFQRALLGMLYSVMRWDQLTQFWSKVEPAAGWYLYAVGTEPPTQTADAAHVQKFIVDLDKLLACAVKIPVIVGHDVPGQVMRAGKTMSLHAVPDKLYTQ